MRRKSPVVRQYMSRVPVEIDRRENLAKVAEVMDAHGIRHLPVLDGYQLYGIVSQRDIQDARIGYGGKFERIMIGNICRRDVLTVGPLASMSEVAQQMLDGRVGSVVVVDGEFVVGVFTTTDALRALRDAYSSKSRSPE